MAKSIRHGFRQADISVLSTAASSLSSPSSASSSSSVTVHLNAGSSQSDHDFTQLNQMCVSSHFLVCSRYPPVGGAVAVELGTTEEEQHFVLEENMTQTAAAGHHGNVTVDNVEG